MAVKVNLPDGNSYLIPDTTNAQDVLESNNAYNKAMALQQQYMSMLNDKGLDNPTEFIDSVLEKYRNMFVNDSKSDAGQSRASDITNSMSDTGESGSSSVETGASFQDPDREAMPGDAVRAKAATDAFGTAVGLISGARLATQSAEMAASTVGKAYKGFNKMQSQMELADAMDRSYSPTQTLNQMMDDYATLNTVDTGIGNTIKEGFKTGMTVMKMTGNPVVSAVSGLIGGIAQSRINSGIQAAQDQLNRNFWGDTEDWSTNEVDATFNNSGFGYSTDNNSEQDFGDFSSDFSDGLNDGFGNDVGLGGIDGGADFSVDTSNLGGNDTFGGSSGNDNSGGGNSSGGSSSGGSSSGSSSSSGGRGSPGGHDGGRDSDNNNKW